ncbi:MAG TPA: PDZ domain-containing protein, partial [Thermoanaerobaculia bacterium]|nr:PDZ domain-containing protein [Thermoanaerobaculia bacterium]
LVMTLTLVAAVAASGGEPPDAQRTEIIKRIEVKDGLPMLLGGRELLSRGYLGVQLIDLTDQLRRHFGISSEEGVLIGSVQENDPASKAGLRAGDIIIALDGKPVGSSRAAGEMIREMKSGDSVRIDFLRGGTREQAFATIDERRLPEMRIRLLDPSQERGMDKIPLEGEVAMKKLEEYLVSPERRIMRLRDCDDLQEKLESVEKRLKELEKKLQK